MRTQTLNDLPFEPIVKYVWYGMTDDEYGKTKIAIMNRANWNCLTCTKIDLKEIERTLNAYVNLVEKNQILEYTPNVNPYKVDKNYTKEDNLISSVAGVSLDKVKKIMFELYYGTLDGTIKNFKYIKPKTTNANLEYQRMPESLAKENSFDTITKTIKWGAISLIIAGGLYVAMNITKTAKNITEK